jgi:hypothetical protein
MAISNPEQGVAYCEGASGARVEWQTPDRDILFDDEAKNEAIAAYYEAAREAQKGTDAEGNPITPPSSRALQELLESRYPWNGYTVEESSQMPIRYVIDEQVTELVETLTVGPGGSVPTVNTLTKNKYYTFVTSGLLTLGGGIFADAIYRIDSNAETTEPSDLLTIDDIQFQNLYFNAARNGTPYDPFHVYSVGYVGNNSTVTFTLANQGSGTFQVDIYENEYRLRIVKELDEGEAPPVIYFDQTRDKPFLNLNIACGGECPTRTSFACECNGTRSCYWDNQEGAIAKIFEGNKNG